VAIGSGVGVLTKLVRIPYTVALVLAGLGLALLRTPISGAHITEELVLLIFLPPLLFQAGLHLDLKELRRNWVAVSALAVPGVVLTTAAAAAAIRWLLPQAVPAPYATWVTALVLGAVVAPTDPISVVAIFRSLGVPKQLRLLVEGESLFNDGTAAALFGVLKTALVAGAAAGAASAGSGGSAHPDVVGTALEFLRVVGIGGGIGLAMAAVAYLVLCRLNDHTLETGITVGLAWGSFLIAEWAKGSGVIAVVAAGLVIGNFGTRFAMSEETRTTLRGFWDSVDFIVNSIVFLLVGLELSDPELGGVGRLVSWPVLASAGAVYGALLIARAVKVVIVSGVSPAHWPKRWNWVIWWAGLRGGLSLALALGLPTVEVRRHLVPVVFLIVLVTLILQATTMPMVIKLSGASGPPDTEA
jgi:CPA1 family monovalent cation:H+ antiporter